MPNQEQHWNAFASRWNRLGSPMRPCNEDVANFQQVLGNNPGDCLLLGVTPELANLTPQLVALDNSADMIRALWPHDRTSILGDWLDMPFVDCSFDHIVGDGCPVLLGFPAQCVRFFSEASRVLKPGGRMLLRAFVGAEMAETPKQVCQTALAGDIKSFHAFKWRLSMALSGQHSDYTFDIAQTLDYFDQLFPDREQLAIRTGWSMHDIATIDFYRDSSARYSYPTLSRLRKIISPSLRETSVIYGSYELAERCPLLVLERSA